jgi:hypothetical protein
MPAGQKSFWFPRVINDTTMNKVNLKTILICIFLGSTLISQGQILDKQKTLEKFDFWSNHDWEWYKQNIPFLETPDIEIDKTYYYRWEVVTIHLVYGSPESGYATTEFIDRPWWSGAFGTISCPAGHQLYDFRWMRDQTYVKDYAKFWFRTPGAQPQNYTNWIGDAVWQSYKVNRDYDFATGLLNDLKNDYYNWEKKFWVEQEGMFAWDGMHDGMETNINSRQTPQWFDGAPGYRPTLNSYMWAQAQSIVNIAGLVKDRETIREFQRKSNTIKTNLQAKTWDPSRNFFFHRFKNDEIAVNKIDTIKANTLTYQTGTYAGSEHGRELIGYVPWYFNMIDDEEHYGTAWKYLMDPEYFYADFGPTVVGRNDPLFRISPRCCVWSGNSWPFATSQTLKAMSNVLNYYNIDEVSREDYFKLFRIYTMTHRKDGKPYIAEALHPDTGSWDGHDVPGHSEHYSHSSYIDLVIADLIGIKAQAGDSIIIKPLVPQNWDYFILEDVHYHGHNITVLWDKTGKKYNRGQGFQLLSEGKTIASANDIKELKAYLPYKKSEIAEPRPVNYAVNNSSEFFPKAIASFPGIRHPVQKLNDGQYWYLTPTTNQWSNIYSEEAQDWAGIDFGTERGIDRVVIYFVEDDDLIRAPEKYTLEYWDGMGWKEIPKQKRQYKTAMARKGNSITFKKLNTSKIRVMLEPKANFKVGISEIEAWGEAVFPISAPVAEAEKNGNAGFEATASYTSRFDRVRTIVDGAVNPNGRWTAFESPNESDWVEIDFKRKLSANMIYIYYYQDNTNIFPPEAVTIEYWNGNAWRSVNNQRSIPEKAEGNSLNIYKFDEIEAEKVRVVMKHRPGKYSGLYEIEFHKK